MSKNDGFVIQMWNKMFYFLEQISIFKFLRVLTKNRSYVFVEYYVVGSLVISILLSLVIYLGFDWIPFMYFAIFLALFKVFEIIVYQINMMFFHPYRAAIKGEKYYIKSPVRSVILLFHNYVEIIFWFSALYLALLSISNITLTHDWMYYVKASMTCFVTLNQDAVRSILPDSISFIGPIVFFEFISGLIMTTITLGRFIGALPPVESLD